MKDHKSYVPRVFHVVTSHVSTRLMRGQLHYLQNKGYEIFLACSPGEGLDAAIETEKVRGIAIPIARELSPLNDVISLWKLYTTIRRIRPSITNVGTPKAGLLGGLAAWLGRVPCRVYTLRGLRWETATGLKRSVLMMADWVSCHCAHRVVCVSQNMRSTAVAAGIVPADRAIVLGDGSSNGVDHERFAPSRETARKADELRALLGIPVDAPVVGFVGRFTRDKGIQELYEAHKSLQHEFKNIRLLLLGEFELADPVPPNLRLALKSDPSVICTGFIDDPCEYYHVFDVLAHPSHREGFPNVVLEAQAAAKPVVGARATGTSDAILDGITGFLVPLQDSVALANAIANLLRNPSLRVRIGADARARVMDRFAPERIWEALANEYQRLLIDKGLSAPACELYTPNVPTAPQQMTGCS